MTMIITAEKNEFENKNADLLRRRRREGLRGPARTTKGYRCEIHNDRHNDNDKHDEQ